MRFLRALNRLAMVLGSGFFLYLGLANALVSFGLIEMWGWELFGGNGKSLDELVVSPWCAFAAVMWFGLGVLFLRREE